MTTVQIALPTVVLLKTSEYTVLLAKVYYLDCCRLLKEDKGYNIKNTVTGSVSGLTRL